MASLNKVLLIGNLTRDVEMRFTPSGTAVGPFGIAINRKFKDTKTGELRDDPTFVDIEVFGKTAELAQKYLSKGKPVFLEGRLKFDQWDDKQSGQKRSKLKVIAEQMQFLGDGQKREAPKQERREEPQQPDDLEIQEENIPF